MNTQAGEGGDSNWFLSEDYLQSASTPHVEVRAIPGKGVGVFSLRTLPRSFVACYAPGVVRRSEDVDSDAAYAASVTTLRNSPSRVFVLDLPTGEHKDSILPMWRNKAVIGHHVNSATQDEVSNAARQPLQVSPIVEGHMFYVPIVTKRTIEAGSEILI